MREYAAAAALIVTLCLTSACGSKNETTAPKPLGSPSNPTQPSSHHTKPAAPPPAPRRVTMHTRTTFHPNHAPATGTFTSTGPGSLCHSGTFADQAVQPLPDGLVLNETFSCPHSNKAVEIRETIHFNKVTSNGSQASTTTWRAINLGDGMKGFGHGKGVATGCTPVGSNIATACTHAVGALTGRLNGES
jgi:hypothetical protein